MSRPEDAVVKEKSVTSFTKHGVLTKKEVFRWNVQSSLVQNGEGRSDVFTFGAFRNFKFCLLLSMDPEKSEYFRMHNQFGVCLSRTNVNNVAEDIAIKVSIGLLDTRDRLHHACEKIMRNCDERVYVIFDNDTFEKHKHIFVRKDSVVIQCTLDVDEILSEDVYGNGFMKSMSPITDGCKDLVEDLASLLKDEKFCDIALCTGGKDFPAHRSIVAARSPVFAAMFEHETLEKLENRVNIEDVDCEVMHHLLKYIYTGRTDDDVSPSIALSLLAASDKYALPSLKKMCSVYLCSNLTSELALNVLCVASLHQDEELKEAAIQVILNNPVQVMNTDDWLAFLKQFSELANVVILRLAMSKSSSKLC